MSDEKYTEKEREFLRLHELEHERELERLSQQRLRVTQRAAARLFYLHDQLERLHRGLYNKAADKVVNMALISYEGDKADYANMTASEIFQDLITPTTEDNDDE